GDESAGDAEAALHARGLDRDGLERALSADTARGRRVEAALNARAVERGGLDLDRVRREIEGRRGRRRSDALGDAKAERELLVVARRPHRHGDGLAGYADLERLLDGDEVELAAAVRLPRHLQTDRAVRQRLDHRLIRPYGG